MSTLSYIQRLPSYSITKDGHTEDPYVRKIFERYLLPDTLEALNAYTRGMYDPELHYRSLFKYRRPIELEQVYMSNTRNNPFIREAIDYVRKELLPLRGTIPISRYEIDKVPFIPTSAAGYSFQGTKLINYDEARSRAFAALCKYETLGTEFKKKKKRSEG